MSVMRNSIAIIILTAFMLFTSCFKNNKSTTTKSVKSTAEKVLSYSFSGINYAKQIDFLADAQFVLTEKLNKITGETTIKKHYGQYKKKDTLITLIPEEVEIITLTTKPEREKEKNTFAYTDDISKINTQYQIVSWGNKEYLLSEEFNSMANYDEKNDFQRFAYYYNTGIEPDESGYYFTRPLQLTDSISKPLDTLHIPEKWRDYFLKKPISATIIHKEKKVQKSNYRDLISWRVQLNKGAKDGIKKGLSFSTKYEDFYIEIDSILPNVSYGSYRINDIDDEFIEIGTEMRTQWTVEIL